MYSGTGGLWRWSTVGEPAGLESSMDDSVERWIQGHGWIAARLSTEGNEDKGKRSRALLSLTR